MPRSTIPLTQRCVYALIRATDCLRLFLRYAWLTAFALFGVTASAIAIFGAPQGREILLDFDAATLRIGDPTAADPAAIFGAVQLAWLVASVVCLGLACWYSSRLLLSRDPAGTVQSNGSAGPFFAAASARTSVLPHAQGVDRWLRTWWPRLLGAACVLPIAYAYAGFAPIGNHLGALLWLGTAQFALLELALRRAPPAAPVVAAAAWWTLLVVVAAAAEATGVIAPRQITSWRPPGLALLAGLLTVALAVRWRGRTAGNASINSLIVTSLCFAVPLLAVALVVPALRVALVFFLAGNAVLIFVIKRRDWFSRAFASAVPDPAATVGSLQLISVFVAWSTVLASYGLVLAIVWNATWIGRLLGAPAVAGFALTSVVLFGAFALVLLPRLFGLPALTPLVLVLALIAAQFNDNHTIRAAGYAPTSDRLAPAAHFAAWRASIAERADGPVYVVASSGGGLRAAYWTARVLAEIDDAGCGALGRRLFAASGVSGGSLGIATFVALLRERGLEPACDADGKTAAGARLTERTSAMLGADFLSPMLASALFADALQRFIPYPFLARDRAYALERSWEQQWQAQFGNDRFAQPFLDLYAGDFGHTGPSLLFNSTTVDEGKRAVASNIAFTPRDGYDLLASNFRTAGMPLSTAIHNSARFTYLSPAGTLRGRYVTEPDGRRAEGRVARIVDGGYFENSGASSAAELIDAVRAGGHAVDFVAIIITNAPTERRWCDANELAVAAPKPGSPHPWLPESGAPIETLLQTRVARGTLASRQLIDTIGGCTQVIELAMADMPPSLETVGPPELQCSADPDREAPLGWYIAPASQCIMNERARRYGLAIAPRTR